MNELKNVLNEIKKVNVPEFINEIEVSKAMEEFKNLDSVMLNLVKEEKIKMQRFNAFRNEFSTIKNSINTINYVITCYNTADDLNKKHLLMDVKGKVGALLNKIEKWELA